MFKEKVYLNRVKVPYQEYFAKANDYFKRHGVEISSEFILSDFKNLTYEVIPYNNYNRIHLKPRASTLIPEDTKYDFISLVFNGEEFPPPNIPTGRCYRPNLQPFLEISTHSLNPKDLTYVEICHERMHMLVMKARQAGFDIPDVMDSYFNNFFLETENSNFGQQWKLLQPYIKSLQPPLDDYFKTQDFVSKAIYQQYGEKSIWFIDPRIRKLANFTRKFFNKPVTINNLVLDQRGFREPESTIGAKLSQHRFGRAIDINVAGMTPKAVYDAILANSEAFMGAGLTCMEDIADTPTWNHLDIRWTGLNNILIVKP